MQMLQNLILGIFAFQVWFIAGRFGGCRQHSPLKAGKNCEPGRTTRMYDMV